MRDNISDASAAYAPGTLTLSTVGLCPVFGESLEDRMKAAMPGPRKQTAREPGKSVGDKHNHRYNERVRYL